MGTQVITVVDAVVDADREADLLAGYRSMSRDERPDGLVRSQLLRGRDGAWRIQTTWRDLDAIIAVRRSGVRPAALDLFERLGAETTHGFFTVETGFPE
jgi:hypothetical protein